MKTIITEEMRFRLRAVEDQRKKEEKNRHTT